MHLDVNCMIVNCACCRQLGWNLAFGRRPASSKPEHIASVPTCCRAAVVLYIRAGCDGPEVAGVLLVGLLVFFDCCGLYLTVRTSGVEHFVRAVGVLDVMAWGGGTKKCLRA